MGGLTKLEQETIILFNEAEETAEIFTYNGAMKRKLHSLCDKFPEQFAFDKERSEDNGSGGEFFTAPKRYVKVASPRILSQEQKEKRRKQAKKNLELVTGTGKVS